MRVRRGHLLVPVTIGHQLQVWLGHRLEAVRTIAAGPDAETIRQRTRAWLLACYPGATIVEKEIRL